MSVREILHWAWTNDREAFVVPVVFPLFILTLALWLEILS